MLLDASQYDLCNSIKNIKDKDSQEKYIKLMTDDKLAAQRIFRALAGLLINPESTQMQDAVKETLLSTLTSKESRTIDIENSNLLTKIKQLPPPSTTANHTITKENMITFVLVHGLINTFLFDFLN